MPHFHIDYSANLEERLDISGLLTVLRDAAMETGIFPLAGIRIRATACDHWIIADGNPDHAFIRPVDAGDHIEQSGFPATGFSASISCRAMKRKR